MHYFIAICDYNTVVKSVVGNSKEQVAKAAWENHVSDFVEEDVTADYRVEQIREQAEEEQYVQALRSYMKHREYPSGQFDHFGEADHVAGG
jgi:hypothetical protein